MSRRRWVLPLLFLFTAQTSFAELTRWQSFSLSWYLRRARQDMKIGSFRPAIEAYQKAVGIDPDNREGLRNLGIAYEAQGLIDSAVATYDHYLAKYPDDSAIAFRQAEILSWTRYEYRKADSIRYRELAMKNSPNPTAEADAAKVLPTQSPNQAKIAELELALSHDPNNGDVMKALARAYEHEGEYEKAVALNDRYLSKHPDDADVALHQAEILSWNRFSDRKPDALRYYQLGLEKKSEPDARIQYAQMLAADKATSSAAIDQFEKALESDPKNVRALMGLAMATSWNGDGDRAIYFAEMAVKADPTNKDAAQLLERLRVGREASVRAKVDYFSQHGGRFGLRGLSTSLDARADVTPFVTLFGEAGHADYWHRPDHVGDVFASLGVQARLKTAHQFEASFGHHSIGPESRSLVYDAGYGYQARNSYSKLGFKQELRTDSLAALVSARSHSLYAELSRSLGGAKLWFHPYAGWVSTASLDDNKFWGADLRADSPTLLSKGAADVSAAYKAEGSHYQLDQSNAGGYFSPKAFINQTPLLVLRLAPRQNHRFEFEAGPSLQYVRDAGLNGKFRFGAEGNAGYSTEFTPNWSGRLSAGFVNVSNVYNLFSASAALIYRF